MQQLQLPSSAVFRAGDTITFRLADAPLEPGRALLRTTIGGAAAQREEQIALTETGRARHGLAWRDLEMHASGKGEFSLTLPLVDVGVFEAKCCFAPANGAPIQWPAGGNFRIKVEPAFNVGSNSIYCAFVRQFGAGVDGQKTPQLPESEAAEFDAAGYTLIPPSGTFRRLIGKLDHIFGALGCRILQLLPIHPTPTVYGRMGRYGSPFASLDYFAVDPALAEFDPKATPLEQFGELVDAVHARHGRIFLDIPVNHTGWASRLQAEHPEYFVRRQDRTFESPGAWGVVWEDLCKLDYTNKEVHHLMAKVFLHWCRLGVDGFRCDAGYMLPAEAWDYIVARVRDEYPDTVFMLEGLGGLASVQEKLLAQSGLDWAYSELFQNYSRDEISNYYPYVSRCADACGTLVNFAETHDNSRLAAVSPRYAEMRCKLCALLAVNGAFGFANGVEFFAKEKIDVHGAGSLNWGASPNLVGVIRRLNALLAWHPAFLGGSEIRLIQRGPGNLVVALRKSRNNRTLLVAVNCDAERAAEAHWDRALFAPAQAVDLWSGKPCVPEEKDADMVVPLAPGEALCLSGEPADLGDFEAFLSRNEVEPEAVLEQRATAAAFAVWRNFGHVEAPEGDAGALLRRDPLAFCRTAAGNDFPAVTRFRAGRDERRIVPLPPGDVMLIESRSPFRVELCGAKQRVRVVAESLPRADGLCEFALLVPPANPEGVTRELEIRMTIYDLHAGNRRLHGRILQLGYAGETRYRMGFGADEVRKRFIQAFAANNRGGMTLIPAAWSELYSKYNALLAANGTAPYPVDRRTMFTRMRAWLVVADFSTEISNEVLSRFCAGVRNTAEWQFLVPAGQGRQVRFRIHMAGALDGDALKLAFHHDMDCPDEESPEVRIVLRPDVENRVNHQLTKAFAGAENHYPASVRAETDAFTFAPDGDFALTVRLPGGRFVPEPEWHYMVELPLENYYGQEHTTDLFSPGYFEFRLAPGAGLELFTAIDAPGKKVMPENYRWPADEVLPETVEPREALREALGAFVVRRDEFKTVIAGYPWFLDWGRDTLIALRGLIRGGYQEEARDILRQFASFEEAGTIPNIIHGGSVGNRDTSDAPLWLGIAARDYIDRFGDESILDSDCRGRTFRRILISIVEHYMAGTPNGIQVDKASLLVFSPPHFTWMDTNYPAGTPREGYPIEIQAMWYASLAFLGRFDAQYQKMAETVRASLQQYFYLPKLERFSDCLHCTRGVPAAQAVADDHVRSNQLLAVTLGAVVDPLYRQSIIRSAAELLVPGSIRSLSDRPVEYRLPVWRDGHLLNDPAAPYRGYYRGPEDTSRKVAYHNGTAWGWQFPAYCEALYMAGGEAVRCRALSLLESTFFMADGGIPGQLPEVADGDLPHHQGGCPAQAWSVTEAYRVFDLLLSETR